MPSVKRRSAKRLSVKRRSVKRRSAKRLSPKKSSPKKHSLKKSSPEKVTSEYKMSGMGVLLNMYGGASEALEQQVAMKLKEIAELKRQLAVEKNKERMIQIQKAIVRIESDIQIAKEKMKHLLKGAADTVSKAAASLGTKTSGALSKFSSDLFSYRSRAKAQSPAKSQAPAQASLQKVSMDNNVVLDDYQPFSPSIPPAYSFRGGSKKYERRIEKRFVASSPSKISLSITGESEE
jgi:uncharacterized protein YfaS (alpha-2-macroglobulin family)